MLSHGATEDVIFFAKLMEGTLNPLESLFAVNESCRAYFSRDPNFTILGAIRETYIHDELHIEFNSFT